MSIDAARLPVTGTACLSVEAVGVATLPFENYLPLSSYPAQEAPMSQLEREHGIPREHVIVMSAEDSTDAGPDVSKLVLDGLGAPECEQPLFFVRSGPLRDSLVAKLAQLVHESGWAGEDVGITHLEELGGTVIFGMLEWAVPADTGATVVICDEPLFADVREAGRFAAVGLRVRQGAGPLRVVGCGEGTPGDELGPVAHRFTGRRLSDGWLAFHEALTAGKVRAGDLVLVGAQGPVREGWLLLDAVDPASVRLSEHLAHARS